jgi:molecular chaperone GrpE (heat shock protein)
MQEAFDSLRQELRTASGKADRSSVVIERLEAENRALKSRESERRQEPLIKGVISLFDDLRSVTRHAQSQAARGAGPSTHLLQSLLVFERQALEVLRRNDVEAFEPGIADPFDANRQEAWETVDTALPDQEMRVAEVIRLGFQFGGRVIRPAAVKVHRFRAAASAGGNR